MRLRKSDFFSFQADAGHPSSWLQNTDSNVVVSSKPAKTKAQLEAEEKAVKKALAENQRQLEKARKAKKNKARRGRGRKVPTNNDDDSDDEYDGTSRSWAH